MKGGWFLFRIHILSCDYVTVATDEQEEEEEYEEQQIDVPLDVFEEII